MKITEVQYEAAVSKCRVMIIQIKDIKHEVARISYDVTEEGKGRRGAVLYTPKKFAKDVGVSLTSLCQWRREYSAVTKKIKTKKNKKLQGVVIREILKRGVVKDTPKKTVQRIYEEVINQREDPDEMRIINAIEKMDSIQFLTTRQLVLKKCSQDSLKNLFDKISKTYWFMNKHFKETDLI